MSTKILRAEGRSLVQSWVSRHEPFYAYMTDFFDNGGDIRQCSEDALVLYDEKTRICYAAGESCSARELRSSSLVLSDSRKLAESLIAEGVYPLIMECITGIYWEKEPLHIRQPGISTRALTENDLQFVLDNYDNPGCYEAHIRERIAYGMIGGLIDGELAGFAGVHQEGSVGMLEVLPRFRRRGLAAVLEAEAINLQLKKKRLPYCHIQLGNEASVALQKKLGLSLYYHPVFWVG